jgi:GMP synthase-like glutamine amidotransferase
MARLAVIHHLEQPFLGMAERPFAEAGLVLDERFLPRGDALPSLEDLDGVLSLGGAESMVTPSPDLLAEAELLRAAAEAEIPVLGVCLGAQILSFALGGEVHRDVRRTVAWRELTPAVADDPLVGPLPVPVPALHWNEDVFTLPPGAVELFDRPAAAGVEGFRYGRCAWAVQFHPDVDRRALEGWYGRYDTWLAEAGVDATAARAADDRWWNAHETAATAFFAAFAAQVTAHTLRSQAAPS